jgi:hypothetical protein
MSERELQDLFARARLAAERRGAVLVLEAGAPASEAEIEECERALDRELPKQLRSFLQRWNGITIKCYPVGWSLTPEGWTDRFDVADTKMIVRLTHGIRDFFAMGAEAHPYSADERRRIDGLLVLSSGDDLVIHQALDRRDANGNCPVMKFTLEYYPDWLDDPGVPIAASVDEFTVRSLRHMADTGESFLYWL